MSQLRRMLIEQQQSDLQFVEYLESTGTQWINTGYVPTSSTGIKAKFKYGEKYNVFLCGCNADYVPIIVQSSKIVQYRIDNVSTSFATADSELHTIEFNIDGKILYDSSQIAEGISPKLSNVFELGIFASKTTLGFISAASFYSFRIYEGSTLVRNFVPAIYNGVPCMWETVEGKPYYNQGTGEFLTGDVIDLRFYEYLESNGTQYIDSGLILGGNNEILIDSTFTKSSSQWLCGSRITGCTIGLYYSTGTRANFGYGAVNTDQVTATIRTDGQRYLWKINNDNFYLDGIAQFESPSVGSTYPNASSYIFALNASGVADSRMYVGKCYSVRIYDNDIVVRDFIPCSYNGEYGMLDLVEFKFYGNIGTGVFTVGKEVKHSFV